MPCRLAYIRNLRWQTIRTTGVFATTQPSFAICIEIIWDLEYGEIWGSSCLQNLGFQPQFHSYGSTVNCFRQFFYGHSYMKTKWNKSICKSLNCSNLSDYSKLSISTVSVSYSPSSFIHQAGLWRAESTQPEPCFFGDWLYCLRNMFSPLYTESSVTWGVKRVDTHPQRTLAWAKA